MSKESFPNVSPGLEFIKTIVLEDNTSYDVFRDVDGVTRIKPAEAEESNAADTEELPPTSGDVASESNLDASAAESLPKRRPRRVLGGLALTTALAGGLGLGGLTVAEVGDRTLDIDDGRRGIGNHMQNIAGDLGVLKPSTVYDNARLALGLTSGLSIKSNETQNQ